jgi:DNA-binding transcriptional MerR regulator
MTPKLYKAADVCDLAQVQPYVLRSWEKEFPGIGVQKSPDGPRLYRQSDVDQVLRIKQLVFEHGLTLSGAKRKLEDQSVLLVPLEPAGQSVPEAREAARPAAAAPAKAAPAGDTQTHLAQVRDGLRSILTLLSEAPGTAGELREYVLAPPAGDAPTGKRRTLPARPAPAKSGRDGTGRGGKRPGRASV